MNVSNTILLHGPNAETLKTKALELAEKLLKAPLDNHPDLHILIPEGKNGLHTQAAIQSLIRETAFPPYQAPAKVFLIEEADQMLPSASNALLKTLEEPPEDTTIILLSTALSALLPTVRSRCRAIECPAPISTPSADAFKQLLALAQKRDWPNLLKALDQPELPDPCSHTSHALVAERTYRLALARNIKPRNALLNYLLHVS